MSAPFPGCLSRKTGYPLDFSCSHTRHCQTSPWLGKAARENRTEQKPNRIAPPHMHSLAHSGPFYGYTAIKYKVSIGIFTSHATAVLCSSATGSTLRDNLQEGKSRGHPPWCRLLLWVLTPFHNLPAFDYFSIFRYLIFIFYPSFLVVSATEIGCSGLTTSWPELELVLCKPSVYL